MSYIIEFKPQGRYVKVTAVDPETGIEAVLVGDAKETPKRLEQLAVQKLEFVLKSKSK